MKNVGVLLVWNLLVWSAAGDLEVSKNSTSSSASFRTSGEICLNGGVSVPSLTAGRHMFCLCADGFEGKLCETAKAQDCYAGVGHDYRGTVSTSRRGRTCEEWDAETRQRYLTSDVNSGRHNYCRNLNFRRRPWCYVRRNLNLVAEYCDVPRCILKPTPPSPAATETQTAEMTCGLPSRRMQYKIVGGTVTTVESHPWYAAIFRQKRGGLGLHCGGSLISPCWVLTAAHCIHGGSKANVSSFSVFLGRNRLHEENPAVEQQFGVEQIFIHEEYGKYDDFNNDIALMKLEAKNGQCAKRSDFVNSVCLPPPQQFVPKGTLCEIVGFGDEKEGKESVAWLAGGFIGFFFGATVNPPYLKEAQVNIFPDNMCDGPAYYGKRITENMFCAGRLDWSRDSCQGDSGGPLACEVGSRFFQFGIVSWGDGCARPLRPGVYTKLSNYNQWIEEKTGLPLTPSGVLYPEK